MKGQERLSSEQPFDPLSYRKNSPGGHPRHQQQLILMTHLKIIAFHPLLSNCFDAPLLHTVLFGQRDIA
jgi:hypothetical protein